MDQSPLHKLPAEMRNRIYDFALIQEKPILLHVKKDERVHLWEDDSRKHLLALSSTCKQIRTESLPVFFKGNCFETTDIDDSDRNRSLNEIAAICAWKTQLGAWASCLRSLDINFYVCAEGLSLYEGDQGFWSDAFRTLRDAFNLPKLLFAITFRGYSSGSGHELSLYIVGDETDEALAYFREDFKQLEERIISESQSHFHAQSAIMVFEAMAEGVEFIVDVYKG